VNETQPLISVIVTSYSMERLGDLTALLGSLENQTYPHIEIILVLEKSQELLSSVSEYVRQKGYANVRLLFNSGASGASAARNLGVRGAHGALLAFIDDDGVATAGWLEVVVNAFEKRQDVVGVTGPILPLWENGKFKWLPEEFYWIVSCMPASSAQPFEVRNAWGNNMSFRREAFEKGGLFLTELGAKGGGSSGKHELVGEDTEFSLRARRASGKRIICAPEAVVYHRADEYRFSNSFIASRAYWEGYTKVLLKKALGKQHTDTLAVEHKLLGNILMRLLPSTLAGLVTRPVRSWKRLKLIAIALSGIALGYARGTFQRTDRLGGKACIEYL